MPRALADALRRTSMSRYIWVIEVVDRQARAANQPDVIGEIVLDATLTQFEPDDDPNAIISLHVGDSPSSAAWTEHRTRPSPWKAATSTQALARHCARTPEDLALLS